jgi:hypothetical protein
MHKLYLCNVNIFNGKISECNETPSKKFFLIILALLIGNILMAGKLVLVKTSNPEHAQQLIANPAFAVHYYSDAFVIATVSFCTKRRTCGSG